MAELDNFEQSSHFTQRQKVALRYADAITWDPTRADDAMWADLKRHFSEPELVEHELKELVRLRVARSLDCAY